MSTGKLSYQKSKPKPLLYSIVGAAVLLMFWIDLNRARDEKEPIVFKFINEESGEKTPDQDNNQAQTAPNDSAQKKYKDGEYAAGSSTPWGMMKIKVIISDGLWKDVQLIQTPDSPPSYYSVKTLVRQALNAQSADIQGVSGATYTSNAFYDDLSQIVEQSKI